MTGKPKIPFGRTLPESDQDARNMHLRKFSNNVYFAAEPLVSLQARNIEFLKRSAVENQERSVRICMHTAIDEKLHEMLIVHSKSTYVRPHKHINKSVSFHVVEGSADLVVFNELGDISEVIPISEYRFGGPFYFRISDERYYTQLVRSEFFAFHEVTVGPFRSEETVWAPWAPLQDDRSRAAEYIDRLMSRVHQFRQAKAVV